MKKLLKYAVCLAMLVMVLALLTGCADKATGGGLFYAGCGEEKEKVTFGFNVQRVDGCVYKGQLQAVNHETKQKFHMDEITLMSQVWFDTIDFVGQDKDDRWVNVTVTDKGEPGASEGDWISILHQDYGLWAGPLEGGNIQLHEEKD